MAISNSYKLYLAINGSKNSFIDKRDPQQHRKWREDLVDLLFQVDNDDFGADFMSKDLKPYPKYQYQTPLRGPKIAKKEALLTTINGSILEHLYALNLLGKKGNCFFCPKKSNLGPLKEQEKANSQFGMIFQLNQNDLIQVIKSKEPKKRRFQGVLTRWWCETCQKFICKNCWSLYH
jgi:hypothetical protein